MNLTSNRLWIVAFPLSLALLAVALYIKRPAARDFVDRHCPWVKQTVGKYAPPFEVQIANAAPAPASGTEDTVPSPQPVTNQTANAAPPPAPPPTSAPDPAPSTFTAVASPFDLDKVCADPSRWPKTVRLKAAVDFPAVVVGKVVGKLRAPAGAETRVMKLANGQVGVEYHGGGAWLDFDRTDFVERARIAWH